MLSCQQLWAEILSNVIFVVGMDNTYLYAIIEHFLDDDDEESTVCRQIINVGQFLAFQAVDRADVVKIEGYI